ncbi:MAG TPA: hypothetical protein VLF68_05160 [Candidatus Saccharimonadales bacterium]|nr:hypothetical protein [Candidatus Saccharimonadales bacterium]
MKKTAQKIHSSTQKFTEVSDIIEDVVLLSGGNACLIIEVTATNFALLSKQEQDTKIYSYASLLNSLSFPIEIMIRSKRLDVSSYLKLLDGQAAQTQNQMLATQIKLYRDFVQQLVQVNTVLDKKFYISISYSSLEQGATGATHMMGKKKNTTPGGDFFQAAKASLHSKADSLHSQLARLNLRAKTLSQEELIKLFYELYNGDTAETNQITDNIKTAIISTENT